MAATRKWPETGTQRPPQGTGKLVACAGSDALHVIFLVGTEPSRRCSYLAHYEDILLSPQSGISQEKHPFFCNTEALLGGILLTLALYLSPPSHSPKKQQVHQSLEGGCILLSLCPEPHPR